MEWGNESKKKCIEEKRKTQRELVKKRKNRYIKKELDGWIGLCLLVMTSQFSKLTTPPLRGLRAHNTAAWHWLRVTMEIKPVGGVCACVCVPYRDCRILIYALQGADVKSDVWLLLRRLSAVCLPQGHNLPLATGGEKTLTHTSWKPRTHTLSFIIPPVTQCLPSALSFIACSITECSHWREKD